jgi:hypothetical protein
MGFGRDMIFDDLEQARFADAGLAAEQDDLPKAVPHLLPST